MWIWITSAGIFALLGLAIRDRRTGMIPVVRKLQELEDKI